MNTILQLTFEKWYNDDIPRHAAVLAFYTLFAIAPILLLCVEILGLIYGRSSAEEQVLTQTTSFFNSTETAEWVTTFLRNILPSSANWWVTAGFMAALLYGASSFFCELKIVLNRIWNVPLPEDPNISRFLLRRLQAVLMVLISSLLIFFGLIMTNWLSTATSWGILYLNMGADSATWSYLILVFLLLTITFALIYKFVPDANVAWKNVWIGAAATALLISITRLLISLYFNYSYTTTMFGAASALVVLLLSVYYSAQIFFLGAEFTYVYSQAYPHPASERVENSTQQSTTHKKLQLRPTTPVQLDIINIKSDAPDPTPAPIAAPTPQKTSRLAQLRDRLHLRLPSRKRNTPPTTDHPTQDHPTTDHPTKDHPTTDHPTTDHPTTDHPTKDPPIRKVARAIKQFLLLPIRVLRPLHQIVVAVGVIFAISLAALAGLPFWRKRKNRGTVDPIVDDPVAEDE